jgi:hypothetical protein
MACNNKCSGKLGPICPPLSSQVFGDNAFYTSNDLPLGIKTNDSLNTVVKKLAAALSCVSPVITSQPSNVSVDLGQPFTLSATFDGNNITYKWYKDGVLVVGATDPTLYIAAAQASDFGSYYVVATNTCGSAQSNAATVGQAVHQQAYITTSTSDGTIPGTDPTTWGSSVNYTPGQDLTVTGLETITTPSYFFVAVPVAGTKYDIWFLTSANSGAIDVGAPGSNLFYYTTTSGYDIYATAYPTLFPAPNPLILKI